MEKHLYAREEKASFTSEVGSRIISWEIDYVKNWDTNLDNYSMLIQYWYA